MRRGRKHEAPTVGWGFGPASEWPGEDCWPGSAPGPAGVAWSDSAEAAGPEPKATAGPVGLATGADERFYGVGRGLSGRPQRRSARAARQLEAHHRQQLLATRKRELEALRAEQRQAQYLPAAGEPGQMAGRSYRRLRLPAHRATSEVLAGAYPFLAEEGLGSAGALVGQDAWSGTAFCYDPLALYQKGQLTNPNIFLAGPDRARQVGPGQVPGLPLHRLRPPGLRPRRPQRRVVGGRPGRRRPGGGPGDRFRRSPQPPGRGAAPFSGVSDDARRAQVAARRGGLLGALSEPTLGRPLVPTERSALDAALADALQRANVPVLPLVVDALLSPPAAFAETSVEQLRSDGRDVGHALARLVRGDLAGLFDGPSTVAFDPSLPMLSLDLSAISGSEMLIGLVMTCASTWLEAALADTAGGQRLVVYDEAWRLLAQPALLARMQAQWKLSRAWASPT